MSEKKILTRKKLEEDIDEAAVEQKQHKELLKIFMNY